jgi:hypothetical protein
MHDTIEVEDPMAEIENLSIRDSIVVETTPPANESRETIAFTATMNDSQEISREITMATDFDGEQIASADSSFSEATNESQQSDEGIETCSLDA